MNQCVQETTNDYLHLKASVQDLDTLVSLEITWKLHSIQVLKLLETLDSLAVVT